MDEIPTLPAARDATRARRAALWRAAGLAALAALVVLALTGAFGPATRTRVAAAGGTTLELTYPAITRSGLPAPLGLRVAARGGFAGPVSLQIGGGIFDRLDFQSWYPTPAAETAGASGVLYEFDPPPGDVLQVSLDARTSPGQLFGGRSAGSVCVLDASDRPVVCVDYEVWVTP